MEIEKQAKISVVVVCIKKNKGTTSYLVQQRLKEPFYGFHGFITGKIRWGETPKETAARELKEETDLTAKLTFVGIEHKTDLSPEKEILEDKYFFIFKGKLPKGKLNEEPEGGKNIWLTKKELFASPDLFQDVKEIIKNISQKDFKYTENKFINKKY